MPKLTINGTFILQNALLASKLSKKVDLHLGMHGISFTEYMIMHQLNGAALHTMRRIELAEHVGLSASGITRLIAPMEKIKLVEKESNPRDARQSLVKLSETGLQLYKDASITFEQCATSLLSNVSSVQVDKMLENTQKLL